MRGGDEAPRRRLRKLSSERRRFGYRRLHIPFRRLAAPAGAARQCDLGDQQERRH